jgi:NRPS condensation-like uncharacterized protein
MKDIYYLNGIDWVMATLDHSTRRRTGGGTCSQVAVELAGTPLNGRIEETAVQFTRRLPVIHGRISRALNLAPYWHIPSRIPSADIVSTVHVPSRAKALAFLEKAVNTPFARRDEHVHFYTVTHPEGAFFSLVFDHLILDARGAETLLSLFNEFFSSGKISYAVQSQGSQLSAWKRKFSAGQRVNRFFLALGRKENPGKSILKSAQGTPGFGFRHLTFDLQQSRRIVERAEEKAGYLMLMPYALAAVISAMREARLIRSSGYEYLIPVNLDTRPPDRAREEVFFNHVSFMFFRVREEDSPDMGKVLETVKQQMYEQVKNSFPRDLEEASLLMRIVPVGMLHSLLGAMMRENDAAFAFSYNASGGFTASEFMNIPVRSVFHTPRVPVPPGMGMFFTRYGECLSVVFSYLRGKVSESDADAAMVRLRALLLGG